ncbi:trypsin-like peptidase domain-containing protein [Lacibacter sp. H375]|uniref:trypsin-like peptidase domain-containing protein n=1 Tax=Lacibacter sp. H375 TaxID=3133424 RepID=UPI0030C1AC4B
MFHEPSIHFLYSSYKIQVEHTDGYKVKTGTATAFLLEIGKNFPWIITNRHVVDLDYNQPTAQYKDFKLSKFQITGRKPDDSEYTYQLYEKADIYYHDDYENDVAIIKAHVDLVEGQSFHWHFGMEHLADEEIFKQIQPFDLICYSGFPDSHDKLANRPILRSGHIASDPKFHYSWNKKFQGQCVAYEGFSSPGASGSPVFAPPRGLRNIPNSRHGYLIGVNAGHIPENYGHSGISYFYKSTVIKEIIEKHRLKDFSF